MQVAQGDLAGALTSYRDSLAIADRLAKSDPGNAGWQRDLSVSYEKVGDVQVAQGDLAGRAELLPATASRSETGWRNPIPATPAGSAISRCRTIKSATCRSRRATSPGALTSYRDSLAISDRLAKSDPGNAGWQRDLSVSYDKVGDVQVAQGDLAGRADLLPRQPRDWRPAGEIRSRQRRLAARSLGVVRSRSATCRSRRATSPGR